MPKRKIDRVQKVGRVQIVMPLNAATHWNFAATRDVIKPWYRIRYRIAFGNEAIRASEMVQTRGLRKVINVVGRGWIH